MLTSILQTTKVGNTEGDAEGRSSYGAVGTTSVTQAQIPQEQASISCRKMQ